MGLKLRSGASSGCVNKGPFQLVVREATIAIGITLIATRIAKKMNTIKIISMKKS